jgi:hypothetical protein
MSNHGKYSRSSLNSGGFTKKKRFYLADGSNLFRLLPPFGTMAEKGIIAKYWEVYWVEGTDGRKRPMPSILKTKSNGKGMPKTVLVADPMFDKVQSLRTKVEMLKKDKNQPEAVVNALEETLRNLNLDKAYYLNVISPSGEIGVLKLRYTAFQNLKTRLDELDKDGIDPINVGEGIIFDFKKMKDDNGKTVYPVDIATKTYRDPNTNRFVSEFQTYPIDENTLKRMDAEASDLGSLYKVLTPEEVALIATLDKRMVDRVYSRPEQVEESASEESEELEEEVSVKRPSSASPTATSAATVAQSMPAAVTQATAPKSTVSAPSSSDVQDIVNRFLNTGKV